MTHEENMQMQDAVRNGVITYEQYIDWLRQADPDGRGAPSREYFNNNNIFGGLGGNGLADFVQMIGAIYGQNPYAPAQQPWTYKANPYTEEQLDRMAREGIYARTPGYWGVDTDGNAVWHPETINNAYGGSFSAESTVPGYVTDMNTVVQAMNNINNGYDLPSEIGRAHV